MERREFDFEMEPAKRPSFLTWLCILTFIGSGWAIISCIWSYTSSNLPSIMVSQRDIEKNSDLSKDTLSVKDQKENFPFGGKLEASFSKIIQPRNIRMAAIGGFIAALFTLTGALLMWNLRKSGFYLYIAGVAWGIMVPFYIFGNDLIAVGATSFANFFGLVFIALYALNLKSMKGMHVN